MSQRTVTSSSLRAALAWLAVFALGYRALGGARWVVAFAVAALVVAALGWRGLLRPLRTLSAVLVAVALSASVAAVLLLVGFDLLPTELPRVLAHERSAVLEPDRTPIEELHHAASIGDVRTVERLLGAGLSPNVVNMSKRSSRRGETAIFRAVGGDHLDVAEALLEAGATIDLCDRRCRTPLNEACANGHLAAAGWLIGHGAKTGHAYREHALYRCVAHVISPEEAEWLEATARLHYWLLPCAEIDLPRRGVDRPRRTCPVEVPRP